MMATIRITFAIGARLRLQVLTLGNEAEELSNISEVADGLNNPSSEKDVFVEYPEAASQFILRCLCIEAVRTFLCWKCPLSFPKGVETG